MARLVHPQVSRDLVFRLQSPFDLSAYGYPSAGIELKITRAPTSADIHWLLQEWREASSAYRFQHALEGRPAVGVATCTSDAGEILAVALSSKSRCLYFRLPKPPKGTTVAPWSLTPMVGTSPLDFLAKPFETLNVLPVGFGLSRTIVMMYRHLQLDLFGTDLDSVFCEHLLAEAPMEADHVNKTFLPGEDPSIIIQRIWDYNGPEPNDVPGEMHVPLRAWLATVTSLHSAVRSRVCEAPSVLVSHLKPEHIAFFATTSGIHHKLESQLSERASTSVDPTLYHLSSSTTLVVSNTYFKERIRRDKRQTIAIMLQDDCVIEGRVTSADGRRTHIRLHSALHDTSTIANIEVIGRESLTRSDLGWQTIMRHVMEGQAQIEATFFKQLLWNIWQQSGRQQSTSVASTSRTIVGLHARTERAPTLALQNISSTPSCSSARRLNSSQKEAHDAIVGPPTSAGSVVVITGPPGTGKTTVIATSIYSWLLATRKGTGCIYCVAASNVAVKNIASSLAKLAESTFNSEEFRIIVSEEYYREWHEHQYEFGNRLLTTTELSLLPNEVELQVEMGGARIILGTLSLLSSPVLSKNRFHQLYPPKLLLVDEASQIRLDELLFPIDRFRHTLKRVAFFGDGKQLPPYKGDEIKEIKSVFETPLKSTAVFLDTQYRMPKSVAGFISRKMYENKLLSGDKTSTDVQCVKFIDTAKRQQQQSGTSVQNPAEASMIVALVKLYYGDKDFRILTPYGAQRKLIEDSLKKENLPWEDRVYTVDSFQGHEADVILISLARTESLGFLKDERRSNVMLTRLKKAMIIVTSREYLNERYVKQTLVGQLAVYLSDNPQTWVTGGDVLAAKATLPHSSRNDTTAQPQNDELIVSMARLNVSSYNVGSSKVIWPSRR